MVVLCIGVFFFISHWFKVGDAQLENVMLFLFMHQSEQYFNLKSCGGCMLMFPNHCQA